MTLRAHMLRVVDWAKATLRGIAGGYDAQGKREISQALRAAGCELVRRSAEVMPRPGDESWLYVRCLACERKWPVVACTEVDRPAVEAVIAVTAPPAHEGTAQTPHPCRDGPYAWEWHASPAVETHRRENRPG